MTATTIPKPVAQALIRELVEAVRQKNTGKAARLKSELKAAGVLCDPTKPKK